MRTGLRSLYRVRSVSTVGAGKRRASACRSTPAIRRSRRERSGSSLKRSMPESCHREGIVHSQEQAVGRQWTWTLPGGRGYATSIANSVANFLCLSEQYRTGNLMPMAAGCAPASIRLRPPLLAVNPADSPRGVGGRRYQGPDAKEPATSVGISTAYPTPSPLRASQQGDPSLTGS
jgi:hypothetical protein